jgi:hypothetical protein
MPTAPSGMSMVGGSIPSMSSVSPSSMGRAVRAPPAPERMALPAVQSSVQVVPHYGWASGMLDLREQHCSASGLVGTILD